MIFKYIRAVSSVVGCKNHKASTLFPVVTSNKTEILKSSEHIDEKRDGSYRGFGYLGLFSDPLDLAKRNHFQKDSRYKACICLNNSLLLIQMDSRSPH